LPLGLRLLLGHNRVLLSCVSLCCLTCSSMRKHVFRVLIVCSLMYYLVSEIFLIVYWLLFQLFLGMICVFCNLVLWAVNGFSLWDGEAQFSRPWWGFFFPEDEAICQWIFFFLYTSEPSFKGNTSPLFQLHVTVWGLMAPASTMVSFTGCCDWGFVVEIFFVVPQMGQSYHTSEE
jgi:hypothetical protein